MDADAAEETVEADVAKDMTPTADADIVTKSNPYICETYSETY